MLPLLPRAIEFYSVCTDETANCYCSLRRYASKNLYTLHPETIICSTVSRTSGTQQRMLLQTYFLLSVAADGRYVSNAVTQGSLCRFPAFTHTYLSHSSESATSEVSSTNLSFVCSTNCCFHLPVDNLKILVSCKYVRQGSELYV